ncbi:degT/DnrJ/EryC1/StrS aminotransferase [Paenibacillus xanthanilyticus]|uniref:DegT/DnrJ/EryC1/StrS aminotransferase n=1 Tax=Paenibacillus xanthanilyticus TaxID=1783531 RepID=A0ABV8K5Q7_9BACL
MKNKTIEKEHLFSLSFVLSRVLTSGVIMSIEKNESELKGLEKSIAKLSGKRYVSLFNSYTGAVHAALWGQDLVHGSQARLAEPSEQERKFANWLGIAITQDSSAPLGFNRLAVSWDNLNDLERLLEPSGEQAAVQVFDFTPLGFGPAAAIATSSELAWKKAERLKIFGAFDLQTMWTQEESEPELQPAAQFNYRLSPLVAACVKLSLLRRNRGHED